MGYSPTLGRWLEPDPELYVDGANPYQMERSDPIHFTDPAGLDPSSPTVTTEPQDDPTAFGTTYAEWDKIPTFGITMVDFSWKVWDSSTGKLLNDSNFAIREQGGNTTDPTGTNTGTQFWVSNRDSISTGRMTFGARGNYWPTPDYLKVPASIRNNPNFETVRQNFFQSFKDDTAHSCTYGYMRLRIQSKDYTSIDQQPFNDPPTYKVSTADGVASITHNRTQNVFQHLLTSGNTGWTDQEPAQWQLAPAKQMSQTLEIDWDRSTNPGWYRLSWYGDGEGSSNGQSEGNFAF